MEASSTPRPTRCVPLAAIIAAIAATLLATWLAWPEDGSSGSVPDTRLVTSGALDGGRSPEREASLRIDPRCPTDLCDSIGCAELASNLDVGVDKADLLTCVEAPGDQDFITFSASTEHNYDFRAFSESGVKVQLGIYDLRGRRLAAAGENEDPTTRDARILEWTPPRAGTYVLKLDGWGSTSGALKLRHDYDYN